MGGSHRAHSSFFVSCRMLDKQDQAPSCSSSALFCSVCPKAASLTEEQSRAEPRLFDLARRVADKSGLLYYCWHLAGRTIRSCLPDGCLLQATWTALITLAERQPPGNQIAEPQGGRKNQQFWPVPFGVPGSPRASLRVLLWPCGTFTRVTPAMAFVGHV